MQQQCIVECIVDGIGLALAIIWPSAAAAAAQQLVQQQQLLLLLLLMQYAYGQFKPRAARGGGEDNFT